MNGMRMATFYETVNIGGMGFNTHHSIIPLFQFQLIRLIIRLGWEISDE
jgi:hypothetical protein